MTKEEAKRFGLQLLHGIRERNESYPVYANNVKQAIDALSESSDSSEIPNNLEKAAKRYGNNKHPMTPTGARESQEDFIAGAKWDREQMLKEAMEADVNIYGDIVAGKSWAEFVVEMPTSDLGDRVRIIIVKEDSHE